MFVVDYSPVMKITNTDQLPKGSGAKYLEVLEPETVGEPLIAMQWRKTKPKSLPKRHQLVRFHR